MANSAIMMVKHIIPAHISQKSKDYNRYISGFTASLDKSSKMKFYDDFITIYVLTKCYYKTNTRKVKELFDIYDKMYYANRNQIISEINTSEFSDMCYEEIEKLDNTVSRYEYEKQVVKALTIVMERMLYTL